MKRQISINSTTGISHALMPGTCPPGTKQIGSSIFLKTTEDFQNGIIGSFIKFLESAIKEGVNEGRINSLIEDVNNSLQKSGRQIYYERTGSDSYSIYCK